MKNYLFPPFKDDDEKIEEFNAIKNYLPKKFRHELIMFMGSLESYYDIIISKLESERSKVRAENIILRTYEKDYEELKAETKALREQVSDLMIDKDRLVEQVSSNRCNSSSTHTHTISKEIDDYMSHNPKCKGVKLFILPCEEFDEDCEYNGGTIYWDDGME